MERVQFLNDLYWRNLLGHHVISCCQHTSLASVKIAPNVREVDKKVE